MKDSEQVTQSLMDLYDCDDWVMRMNFRAFLALSRLGKVPRDAAILDCGCAMGHFLRQLQSHGFTNLRGIDASPEMAREARRLTGREIVCHDALDLTGALEPGSADVITAMNIQHHLGREEQWARFLTQCHVVLKPGGRLFAREPWPTPTLRVLWTLSKHPRLLKTPLLGSRLQSLADERELLGYFLKTWPRCYRDQLRNTGFAIVRDLAWMGHRIVAARKEDSP